MIQEQERKEEKKEKDFKTDEEGVGARQAKRNLASAIAELGKAHQQSKIDQLSPPDSYFEEQ